MRKPRTFLEFIIRERARLKKRVKDAYKADRDIRKNQACADDETIYEIYEAEAALAEADYIYIIYWTNFHRMR